MAIAWVQDSTTGETEPTSVSVTTAFGATPPAAGHYIVVWAWGWNSANPHTAGHFTCADNATGGTNTYIQEGFQSQAGDCWSCMFYATVTNTKANLIVTVTLTSENTGYVNAVASEFSGVLASTPVDGSAVGTTGSSGSAAPGNLTVAAGDLVCCVVSIDSATSVTVPTGFTNPDSANNPIVNGSVFQSGGGAYKINPGTPTNPTWTVTSGKWSTSQFALKTAVAADTLFGQACL
jgi:hypothetical protein